MEYPKILELSKNYQFTIPIQSENGIYCYGELNITSASITLEISFESDKERNPHFPIEIHKLISTTDNITIILFELRLEKSHSSPIHNNDLSRWFTKTKYQIEYVIYYYGGYCGHENYWGFSIEALELNKWIGATEIQSKLLFEQSPKDIHPELDVRVGVSENLSISYKSNSLNSINQLQSIKKLIPVILFSCQKQTDINAKKNLNKILLIFNFLHGKFWRPDLISIFMGDRNKYKTCSLYIKMPEPSPYLNANKHTFIPLGRNLVYKSDCCCAIPDCVFQEYWNRDQNNVNLIMKYLKFRDLFETEDKFLNYFRILEKLTHQEEAYLNTEQLNKFLKLLYEAFQSVGIKAKNRNDFTKRIEYINKQKSNVEANIVKFVNEIPLEIQEYIGIEIEIIKFLPKLRNDITHANEYNISDETFYKATLYCRILATCAIMRKLGFPWKSIAITAIEMNPYRNHVGTINQSFLDLFDLHGNYLPIEKRNVINTI